MKGLHGLVLLILALPLVAQEKRSVEDLAFLSGHWTGGEGDSLTEEMWSPVANGSLMGMYRQMGAGKTGFFEFLSIEQEKNGPVLRLKHFKPGLIGLEEKDQSVTLDLVSLDRENGAVFVSRDHAKPMKLTYRRLAPDHLEATLIRTKDGKEKTDLFRFRLMKP